MIKLVWDEKFKRNASKLFKKDVNFKKKFIEKIKLFEIDPFNPLLKTHKLSGKLQEYWSFRVNYDIRLIFKFINENEVLLIEIGTHDEVY